MSKTRLIRVPESLALRIEALAAAMLKAHEEGRSALPSEHVERVPAHYAIGKAIDAFEDHARRARMPKARRSASARAIRPSVATVAPGEGM